MNEQSTDSGMLAAVSRECVGLCFGGPKDGELIAAREPVMEYLVQKPLSYSIAEMDALGPIAPAPARGRYRFEQIAYGPMTFWAWVVESPKEHNEHQRQRILGSLNLLAVVAVWVGGAR